MGASTIVQRSSRLPLWIATTALVVAVVLSGIFTLSYFSANRWVDHTLVVQRHAERWMTAFLDAQTNARSYAISGHAEYLAAFDTAVADERRVAAELRQFVSDNPTQIQQVAVADRDAKQSIAILQELVSEVQQGRRAEATARSAAPEAAVAAGLFRSDWEKLLLLEDQLLVARRDVTRLWATLTLVGALLLGTVGCLLLGFSWRIQRARENELFGLAQRAKERLRLLSDIAAALSQARTKAQVVDVILDRGMLITRSDTCTLYVLDEAASSLELIGQRGIDPAIVEKIRFISAHGNQSRTFDYVTSGTSLWAENEAEYLALFPEVATMRVSARRARAFWSVPLFVEGRVLGLLAMGYYVAQGFSSDDRLLVEILSKQCAQALQRATRLEREDQARIWFSTTLRSIGDAVIATDAGGHVTFMNPVAEALTGYSESETLNRPLDDIFRIVSEVTRATVESPVTKVLREGTIVGLANHTVLVAKNGTEIPIDDSGAPIRNDAGQILGVVMVFRDVTVEKIGRARREFLTKATDALLSSLDYQSTLATVAHLAVPTIADWCAVDLLDPDRCEPYQAAVAHVDAAKLQFARSLGEKYPPDLKANTGAPHVIRTGVSELYPIIPQALLESAAKDEEHLRLIKELKLRSAIVVPLKGRRRVLGALTFVYAESGRHYGEEDLEFAEDFARRAAMAIENAVALREAEAARAQESRLRGEAEIASRAKDEFLAMVSHELRTPLNAILGWTVMLQGHPLTAELARGLSIIERNARAQAKLVEDVLDISRIISGKLALNLGPTRVSDVVSASIETVTPAADAKDISLVSSLPDNSLTITADAGRVQQIVWNLLSNAVKFTPKGGQISVNAERRGSTVIIAVEDTGEGIPASALPFVFEPFQQADVSTTRRHGGLGLGLAIVKQLVVAHGGTVDVKSEGQGKGATFVVNLPARSAVPAIQPADTTIKAELVAQTPKIGPRLDGLTVLVVDDEPDALELLGEVLRERGADVHVAASAATALKQLQFVKPDVILSDIGMPETDGFALIRRIRGLAPENGGRTPAAAITAYARFEDAQRAFAAGFQLHVSKPVDPAQLATVVANLGGRSQDDR